MTREEYHKCWNNAVAEAKKRGEVEEVFNEDLYYPVIARYMTAEGLKHVVDTEDDFFTNWAYKWLDACRDELIERTILDETIF